MCLIILNLLIRLTLNLAFVFHNRGSFIICHASGLSPFTYPYGSLDKFKSRSHTFIILGLIPAGITLYLGLELAIHSLLESIESFILASLPFILVYFLFRARKGDFLQNL